MRIPWETATRIAVVPPPRRGGTYPYCPACGLRFGSERRYRRHWRGAHMRPFLDRFFDF